MKTAKGNTFSNLLTIDIPTDNSIVLHMPTAHKLTVPSTAEEQPDIITWVTDLVQAERKGSGVVVKCLEQIEHHRDLLVKAYAKLFESYTYATTPQTRNSAGTADKARRAMLEALPDKVLRLNAGVYLSEEALLDIILPDDRERVIQLILDAIKAEDK